MFEVKGWKLSAPLKSDTSVAKSRDSSTPFQDGALSKSTSKKRKRGHGKSNGPDITAENLGDMYSKHIDVPESGQELTSKKQKQGVPPTDDMSGRKERTFTQSRRDIAKSNTGQDEKNSDRKRKRGDKRSKSEDYDKAFGQDISNGKVQELEKINESLEVANIPRKKHKKEHKGQAREKKQISGEGNSEGVDRKSLETHAPAPKTPNITPKLTALQSAMSAKLTSARFRHLNEQLYTTPSATASALFADPEMFATYHAGFAQQVDVWPENPVNSYIADILASKGKVKRGDGYGAGAGAIQGLPRNKHGGCVIADLGCGTAQLSRALQPHLKKSKLTIHSFDLHTDNEQVTKADIANLPLRDGEVDVAIACLALMGTNWIDFVEEAWRVLRWRGEFWVSEIKSRFARSGGKGKAGEKEKEVMSKRKVKQVQSKDGKKRNAEAEERENEGVLAVEVDGVDTGVKGDTDVSAFVGVLERRGFVLHGEPDLGNKMFVKMRFVKSGTPSRGKNVDRAAAESKGKKFVEKIGKEGIRVEEEAKVLKPCVYKLR